MAEAAVRQRVRRPTDTSGPPPPVRRRRPLPGGRAVVGGFLVSLSAVGIFAGYRQATADDTRTYVVASSDLAVGHRIAAGDLDVVRLELPLPLRRLAYRDPGALEGATVLGPVGRGELLQSSDILVGDGPVGGGREISFAVEAARAVDGQLRTGELIDVLATFGSGADAYTVVVARRARIADRSDPVGGLTGTGEQVVTLSLPSAATTVAVAHAVNIGVLTLVRNSSPDSEPVSMDAATYRAPGPEPVPAPVPVPGGDPLPGSPPPAAP